ncbi:Rho GTPase activation protein [Lactarius indigo]|nr:Rho GTPase activation protein [Lactarius indigo]
MPVRGLEPSKSEEVFDDDCRRAVGFLNTLRLKRVESLDDGYDCLAELVLTPTVKNVLVKYMGGMTTVCTEHVNLTVSTSAEVEKAFAGTDTSGLGVSLGHALSFSIPPLTLYCNYRPDAYSDLIFGVPLVNLTTNQDNVPRVIRMCIEEVEKRGLNTLKIYLVGSIYDAEVLQLRRRFESEETFSFSSTDNIHSVAMLLKLYLWDLPKPLFTLSLEDCRKYRQNRTRYAENDYSMLRSKIRELHPVHRASLEALLLHLFRVASHSDKNGMTVEALAAQFCYTVLRGNAVLEDGVHAKKLVMEDLIQNAHTLFGERPPQSSFSASQSDSSVEGRLTPLLGLSLSQVPKEGVETTTQEEVIPRARGTQAVETSLNGSPPEAGSVPPTPSSEWWLPHPGMHQHSEAPTIPPSRPESVLSNTSDISISASSLVSSTTEFPSSPAASLLSSTTESPPSPAASLRSSTTGTVFPAISERS